MQLSSWHPPGTKDFGAAPILLENLGTPSIGTTSQYVKSGQDLKHIADWYFFLYIYHKSLIQSKVTFFFLNSARRTILCTVYVLCN
jgi:hypothetical protein